MAVLTDLSLLEYLHDAECTSFTWDCTDRSMRRIIFNVHVDDDADYEPWNGRTISLVLSDVMMCKFLGWGVQIGKERISSWNEGVSEDSMLECSRLRSSGFDIPPLALTVVLGSGSSIELVCREISVDVGPEAEEEKGVRNQN